MDANLAMLRDALARPELSALVMMLTTTLDTSSLLGLFFQDVDQGREHFV